MSLSKEGIARVIYVRQLFKEIMSECIEANETYYLAKLVAGFGVLEGMASDYNMGRSNG